MSGLHKDVKKRTFLGLLLAVLLFIVMAAVYLLLFARDPVASLSRNVMMVVTAALLVCAVLFLCGLFLAILSIVQNRNFKHLNWLTGKTLFLLYPLVVYCGRLLHIAQEKIQHSFIAVNNRLVANRTRQLKPGEVLLLLPHCLQNGSCAYKITRNADNCRRCGKCQVPELLELAHRKKIMMDIVSGGTLARQAILKYRPRAIVAVACERDLSSGILDSFPLPVYGVVNERPEGPCMNTRVDLALLEETFNTIFKV